jgi:putative ATP-dependent endonuclease of OLD family
VAATDRIIANPLIRHLTIRRFRGILEFEWSPASGLNVILGGGDVGKTTVLEAIALLLSPNGFNALSDADFWDRKSENGFHIEAVMSIPDDCGINQQSRQAWPWNWNGSVPTVPSVEDESDQPTEVAMPVYCLRVTANSDYEVAHEIIHPDGTTTHLSTSVRRAIGLVRLGGDDRNDRDLRLVQGSALDRLLSDATLRSRLGKLLGDKEVEAGLRDDAKAKLKQLDRAFQKRALPHDLGLGLTSAQGLSIGSLIGLTADRHGVELPLASWGSGTRRLASLEIAAAHQVGHALTVVDEVERGLEPYRLRSLIRRLQTATSQAFLTTHSGIAIGAANGAALWYLDAKGSIGRLPQAKISRQQVRDPETFLARLTIVAEGETEKGFVRRLFTRATDLALQDRGIWIAEGGGSDNSVNLLEALGDGGMLFGAFVDNEGRDPERWARLKSRLGLLLFQWENGCLEENIIKHVATEQLEEFIIDPEGNSGDRLRTLADRLGIDDKSFAAIKDKAGENLTKLIVEAAMGRVPDDKRNASKSEKDPYRKHANQWFKTYEGGEELADKIFTFGVWGKIKDQILPFMNEVRKIDDLPPLSDIS